MAVGTGVNVGVAVGVDVGSGAAVAVAADVGVAVGTASVRESRRSIRPKGLPGAQRLRPTYSLRPCT